MDPAEFYQFGLKTILGSPSPNPASCRTAISRAHFAALNRADRALAGLGASCGKGPQKHGLAVRFLHATDDPDLRTASTALDTLKTLRNRADYDMSDTAVEKVSQAKTALELAKDVMDYLQVIENDPTRRTAATNKIAIYKQKTTTP